MDYDKLLEAFIDNGFTEETASMLAGHIYDWGWEDVRDVLNSI